MTDRDGTLPAGWWVEAHLEGGDASRPVPAIFLARTSSPTEAEQLVRAYRPTLREVRVGDIVKAETLDRLKIEKGQAWGPM